MASPITGLIFGVLDGWLRVLDPATGLPLRIPDEERAARIAAEHRWQAAERHAEREARRAEREEQARREAEQHAEREQQARRAAEARLAALEAQLRSLQERRDEAT